MGSAALGGAILAPSRCPTVRPVARSIRPGWRLPRAGGHYLKRGDEPAGESLDTGTPASPSRPLTGALAPIACHVHP